MISIHCLNPSFVTAVAPRKNDWAQIAKSPETQLPLGSNHDTAKISFLYCLVCDQKLRSNYNKTSDFGSPVWVIVSAKKSAYRQLQIHLVHLTPLQ